MFNSWILDVKGLKISYVIDHNTAYGVTGNQQEPHFYEKIGPSAEPIYEVVAEINWYSQKLNCNAIWKCWTCIIIANIFVI